MLNRVNNNAITNVPTQGAYQPFNAGAAGAGTGNVVTQSIPESEPAAILDVSVEGRELAALQLRKFDPANPVFKFDDESFFSPEGRAQRKAESARSLLEPDTSRMIHTTEAMEGTLSKLVADVVNSKMDPATANRFTSELSRLIQGTYDIFGDPKETLSERVVNRAKGLELAEYIAENYIDEPDEKQKFLNGVKHFANNAELQDKGYLVIEGPQEQIYKPGQFTSSSGGSVGSVFDKAWKEAVKTVSMMSFADDNARLQALEDEQMKILLRDPKNAEIAKMYEAGEINRGAAWVYMRRLEVFGSIEGPSFGPSNKTSAGHAASDTLPVNEEAVANTIIQIRNSMSMDAIREDVQRTIKDMLSTFISYDDYFERISKSSMETAGKIVGHLV